MKKLLIASDTYLPRWDGITRFLVEVIPDLSDDFDITLIAPKFPKEQKESQNIRTVYVPTFRFRIADYNLPKPFLKRIASEVKKSDIVFTQTTGPIGLISLLLAHRFNKPVVSYIHVIEWELVTKTLALRNLPAKLLNKIIKIAARLVYNRATLLMVPSSEIGELLTWQKIFTEKMVVALGVDTEKFVPPESRDLSKTNLGLPRDSIVIGFMPRLSYEKDPMTLLYAFRRLRSRYNIKLLIVGDWDIKLHKRFFKQKNVVLAGPKDDVVPYLQAMDIFVMPSLTETTSLSTLEAMACGCAVIATPVGYIKEYIQPGLNGFLFPKKEVVVLMRLIEKLIKNESVRANLGNAARRTVIERFSWNKTVEQIKESLNHAEQMKGAVSSPEHLLD